MKGQRNSIIITYNMSKSPKHAPQDHHADDEAEFREVEVISKAHSIRLSKT